MGEKKEQKIVVIATLDSADRNLILTGIRLSVIFRKELCLLYQLQKKENREEIREKLIRYTYPLKNELPELNVSVLLTTGKTRNLPDTLADEHEAIIVVANALLFKRYAPAVTESPIPFLFVNPQAPVREFKKVAVPVDIRRENSDTILWCSWFGRFNKSEIIAVAAREKQEDSKKLVSYNIMQARKLFSNTAVAHQILRGKKSSWQNSYETAAFALSEGCDLLVLLGSSVITPLDWLIGLPERKIVANAGSLPVLLVNPRRDNYILCD